MVEERLQRALARAGFGSRRACEDLIRAGRVTVNGRIATLGDRTDPERDRIVVDGGRVSADPALRYVVLHKPIGSDHDARPARRVGSAPTPPRARVFPVGRLDRDTEGLLILTNDYEPPTAWRIRHGVEKEYLAEVEGAPTERQSARLRRGGA